MTEVGKPSEVAPVPEDLSQGRELFVDLFKTSMPLVNLGYTATQIAEAEKSLKQLGNEEGERKSPTHIRFKDPEGFYLSDMSMHGAQKGKSPTWSLNAWRNLPMMAYAQLPADMPIAERAAKWMEFERADWNKKVEVKTFEDKQKFLVAATLFPEGTDVGNIDTLISQISTAHEDGSKLLKPTVWNRLMQRLPNNRLNSTYRAAWLDPDTKKTWL